MDARSAGAPSDGSIARPWNRRASHLRRRLRRSGPAWGRAPRLGLGTGLGASASRLAAPSAVAGPPGPVGQRSPPATIAAARPPARSHGRRRPPGRRARTARQRPVVVCETRSAQSASRWRANASCHGRFGAGASSSIRRPSGSIRSRTRLGPNVVVASATGSAMENTRPSARSSARSSRRGSGTASITSASASASSGTPRVRSPSSSTVASATARSALSLAKTGRPSSVSHHAPRTSDGVVLQFGPATQQAHRHGDGLAGRQVGTGRGPSGEELLQPLGADRKEHVVSVRTTEDVPWRQDVASGGCRPARPLRTEQAGVDRRRPSPRSARTPATRATVTRPRPRAPGSPGSPGSADPVRSRSRRRA